jgi:hypothetical protein
MVDERQKATADALRGRTIGGMIRAQQANSVDASELLNQYLAGGNVNVGNLNPEFRSRLTNTLKAIPEDLRGGIRIVSGYRDNEQQAELRRRFEAGIGGQAAPPGRSQHNYGKAVDINWAAMSPEQQAAWKRAAIANGLMRQYSAPLHWGATGDDGNPWRVGNPLNAWASPTPAAQPRPTPITPEQANSLGMSQADMIEYNKKAAAPPLPPPVNVAPRPITGYEEPAAVASATPGAAAAFKQGDRMNLPGGGMGTYSHGGLAIADNDTMGRYSAVSSPDGTNTKTPEFLASLAQFLRGNA